MKQFLKKIGIIIIILIVVILAVFSFPLFTRFLIHMHLYNNIEEFKIYLEIFLNPQFIWILAIILIGTIIVFLNKEHLTKWLNDRDLWARHKDTEVNIKRPDWVEDAFKKKNFVDNFETEENLDTKIITSEVKKVLVNQENKKINKNKGDKIENKIKVLQDENNNLRFYAAYNIINKKTKELLNIIYCEKSIKQKDFKQRLEYSYIDKNRKNNNINKRDLKKYATNKYETILKGLLYLEIIELADNEIESIALTQYGKEFVEKYIQDEVRDYGN